MNGDWSCKDGWIIGMQPGNLGGILFSKERFEGNVMMSFTVKTQLPATRDLNAVFCATWNEEKNYLLVIKYLKSFENQSVDNGKIIKAKIDFQETTD